MDQADRLPPPILGVTSQLSELVAMRQRGELTEVEFVAAKRLLLGGTATAPRPPDVYSPSGFPVLVPETTRQSPSVRANTSLRGGGVILAVGGIGVIGGCLLPWVTAIGTNGAHDSIHGLDVPGGDSVGLLIAGALLLLCGFALCVGRSAVLSSLALLLTIGAVTISAFDTKAALAGSLELNERSGGAVTFSVGTGLWVLCAFSAIALIGALATYFD